MQKRPEFSYQNAKIGFLNGLFLQLYDIFRNSKDVASIYQKFIFSSVCPFKSGRLMYIFSPCWFNEYHFFISRMASLTIIKLISRVSIRQDNIIITINKGIYAVSHHYFFWILLVVTSNIFVERFFGRLFNDLKNPAIEKKRQRTKN